MFQINNTNMLNISDDDHNVLYHSDLSNIVNYKSVFQKYLLRSFDLTNNITDKLICLKVAIEIMILLDTQCGHQLIKELPSFFEVVIDKIEQMNYAILNLNDDDVYDIKVVLNKITPIFTNIRSLNIDYASYKYAYEYSIRV